MAGGCVDGGWVAVSCAAAKAEYNATSSRISDNRTAGFFEPHFCTNILFTFLPGSVLSLRFMFVIPECGGRSAPLWNADFLQLVQKRPIADTQRAGGFLTIPIVGM